MIWDDRVKGVNTRWTGGFFYLSFFLTSLTFSPHPLTGPSTRGKGCNWISEMSDLYWLEIRIDKSIWSSRTQSEWSKAGTHTHLLYIEVLTAFEDVPSPVTLKIFARSLFLPLRCKHFIPFPTLTLHTNSHILAHRHTQRSIHYHHIPSSLLPLFDLQCTVLFWSPFSARASFDRPVLSFLFIERTLRSKVVQTHHMNVNTTTNSIDIKISNSDVFLLSQRVSGFFFLSF